MTDLRGIIPAVHTAFGAAEEVDWSAQRALFRRLLAEGVHGLFVCGTSAEFPLLAPEERERLVDLALEEAAGRAAVVAHVGGLRPRDAARLAGRAARAGASAVSSVPPYYYAYRAAEVAEYVREVAAAADVPFLYYHIPERTGVALDERLLERLLEVPNVRGMKFSDPDLALQERLQALAGPGFKVFCGVDEILLPSLLAGAAGAVGSTYNFLAPIFLELWGAFQAGRRTEARSIQERANGIIAVLSRHPPLAASKEALAMIGDAAGPPRRPLGPLSPGEAADLRRELREAGYPEARGGA
ncbi:MAG: dihydrodipicolinate synthase family protein [Planctomycetes bacterium]|nr:dihydrodipicolinate synthase family protein [Planctomycetota bacterium]